MAQATVRGLQWESLDEDLSINGLLAGTGDLTREWPPRELTPMVVGLPNAAPVPEIASELFGPADGTPV